MFEAKLVVGGHYPDTEYDEENVFIGPDREQILDHAQWATGHGHTVDVFEDGVRFCRVHVDGGRDYSV